MMSINDITIVITSFKSSAIIRNCLNSIDNKHKVVIVENSNDFDFKKKIEQEYTNVECILTGENLGYGKANNIGLQNVKSKYALILNPDTIWNINYLKSIIQMNEFFENNDIKNILLVVNKKLSFDKKLNGDFNLKKNLLTKDKFDKK